MVIQLLEMSDIDRGGSLEPVDAAAVLRSVAQSMALKAVRYGCAIRFDGEESLPILGREERVRQLCINLIDNAIKYGYPNSTIQVLVNCNRENVNVQVVNSGDGIEEKEIPKLFIPFYRRKDREGKREEGSSGLGLGIVKQLVEQHGGRIDIASRPKGLTVVTVVLPTARAREGQAG